MAPTYDSSTLPSRSCDSLTLDIPQNNDIGTDRTTRRAANGIGPEGRSPYPSSTGREFGSAAELREHDAGAISAADSSQTSSGREPPPTSSLLDAPRATASKSARPATDDNDEQVARYRADLVCARFNSTLGIATLTFSRSLSRVQTEHINLPPPPHPPPSLPINLRRMVVIPLSVLVVP
jgi:hypothetical protein